MVLELYQIPYEIIWNLMKPNKKSYIYVRNVCFVMFNTKYGTSYHIGST